MHVSACGCHFAALFDRCRLLVVYNFEKASNEEELYSQTLDIPISDGLHDSSIYLAFDYGRISVVAVRKKYKVSDYLPLTAFYREVVSSLLK